jgi:hypothetical protein
MATRSPLPGMDPWLERHWGDMHHSMIQYARDLIEAQLPSGFFAAVEETVYVFDRAEPPARVRPDVAVFDVDAARARGASPAASGGAAAAAVAEPVRIKWPRQPIVEGHIEIRALAGGEPLVTAIEVLSPTNKTDPRGRRAYLRKREAYHEAGAAVVEIDLLRAGEPVVDVPWDSMGDELLTPYAACVRRAPAAEADLEVEYYPLSLRRRLPRIPVPLRPGDPDVVLDLQQLIDLAYEKGRYASRIDYASPPVPPLPPEDAAWAREMVGRTEVRPEPGLGPGAN